MTWDLYEALAAVIHAPMLVPVAVAPALLWVQWAWTRRPKAGLALSGISISLFWSLILAYLWRPSWGPQAAWGFWSPLLDSAAGGAVFLGALAVLAWAWRHYQHDPSRAGHLRIQMVWACLWYFTLVLGGL